jgi:exosome complex component RRP43
MLLYARERCIFVLKRINDEFAIMQGHGCSHDHFSLLILCFFAVEIPLVSVGDDGRVFTVGGNEGKTKFELVNREKRKLTLGDIPFSLTCALHKDSILVDPTSEEESIIETYVTVVVDSSDRIVSIQKLGGTVTSMTAVKVS